MFISKNTIVAIVESETGQSLVKTSQKASTPQQFARYVAIMLMTEEEFTPAQIEDMGFIDRTGVYYALKTAQSLIETNKPFKKMYLACVKRLADLEEAA